MQFSRFNAAAVATLVASSLAYDGYPDDLNERLGQYIAPLSTDSRGPCPGLNTLANHGLINRNGSDIHSEQLKEALPRAFGINEDGFALALHNSMVVCEYANGHTCLSPADDGTFILTNLTVLSTPHAFEHDHSYSRQDYKQNYAHGAITDNVYFNRTEFQVGLDVFALSFDNPPTPVLLGATDINAIRLQRISHQYTRDFVGWFQLNIPIQLFETGFIFGATFDRDSQGNMIGDEPLVRADWWEFWFEEESFPTHLGWVPASTSFFDLDFIYARSTSVLATLPASLPSPLPAGATNTTAPVAGKLPNIDPSPDLPLFQGTPYVAPTNPSYIAGETATVTPTATAPPATETGSPPPHFPYTTALPTMSSILHSVMLNEPHIVTSAVNLAGPAPLKHDLYRQKIDLASLKAQVALAQAYETKIGHLAVSLLHGQGTKTVA